MEAKQQRQLLINQYHSFLAILHQRGLSYEALPDTEVEKFSDAELSNLVRQLRDLARTPGDGR